MKPNAVIRNRQPIQPMATDVAAQLDSLPNVRAVVFDVYGTLVVSGSGDVGSVNEADKGEQILESVRACGLEIPNSKIPTIEQLHEQIRLANESRKSDACPKPEVDIVDIWRRTLVEAYGPDANAMRIAPQLAAEYESRANPTWPMPGATELLSQLRAGNAALGIVSNAQVFTVALVEDLTEGPIGDTGFDWNLCVFSNRFRQAKPGPRLFQVLCGGLARRGIQPHQAIYVGNDMLNDVWAASQAGLKTAWFAGDRRSCRRREDDPRCQTLRPDLVLTHLMQLPDCLDIA